MSVVLVVGTGDDSCPPKHQEIFFKELPEGKKELHLVAGAPHTFYEPKHLKELKNIFSQWVEKILG